MRPEGLNVLCNSIWLWQKSERQQKACLSSLSCPIKQQASYLWDSLTTTARDKPMPLCPADRERSQQTCKQTHDHRQLKTVSIVIFHFFIPVQANVQRAPTPTFGTVFSYGSARSALGSHLFLKMTVCRPHARQRTTRPDHRFRALGFWAVSQGSSQKHRK